MTITAYVQRSFDSKQVAKFVLDADEIEPWAKTKDYQAKIQKNFKKMLESKYVKPLFTVGVYAKNS